MAGGSRDAGEHIRFHYNLENAVRQKLSFPKETDRKKFTAICSEKMDKGLDDGQKIACEEIFKALEDLLEVCETKAIIGSL